jgi:Uma2 family endonuclease
MSSTVTKLSYEDFLLFPEDDGHRHELIDGEHFMTPAPNLRHQQISGNLHIALGTHLREHRVGRVFAAPTDVVLSNHDVVEPDLVYVSNARAEILTKANVRGAPDLVVEILSDSTRKRDETLKLRGYEKFGVDEYWIVDPELETVKVLRPGGNRRYVRVAELSLEQGDTLTTPPLPGFSVALVELFAE